MTDESKWITVNKAAELSGYNPVYLRRLIRNEKIDYRMFGFMYQVNKKSLLKYLKEAEKQKDKRYSPKRKT